MSDTRLLVVSYFFPPSGQIGAMRATKFVKYLLRLGWQVRVLAGPKRDYQQIDETWLDDVREADVRHIGRLPRVIQAVQEQGFYWLPILLPALIWHVIRFRPDVMFFTGGPFYHWPAARIAHALTGTPYILDFRDPWAEGGYRKLKGNVFSRVADRLDHVLEPFAVNSAAAVLHVTDHAKSGYQKQYPDVADRMVTVPNGFDPDDLTDLEPIRFTDFDIVYTGKFGGFRDVRPFFQAYKTLIDNRGLTPDQTRFIWVGQSEPAIVELISSSGLTEYAELVGFQPYRQALRYIKGAAAALLISGSRAYEPTTKVFDYLGMGTPILGLLGVEGFLSGLLSANRSAHVCVRPTGEHVLACLEQLLDSRAGLTDSDVDDIIQRFNRARQAETLDRLMRKLI